MPARPLLRTTHTYATLEISDAAFDEIRDRIRALGPDYWYPSVIHWGGEVGLVRSPKPPLDPLVETLREAGFVVAEGTADVRNLIHAVSGDDEQPLCSGFRVFPGGARCQGCADCSPKVDGR